MGFFSLGTFEWQVLDERVTLVLMYPGTLTDGPQISKSAAQTQRQRIPKLRLGTGYVLITRVLAGNTRAPTPTPQLQVTELISSASKAWGPVFSTSSLGNFSSLPRRRTNVQRKLAQTEASERACQFGGLGCRHPPHQPRIKISRPVEDSVLI